MKMERLQRISERIVELKQFYDLSEAEFELVIQLGNIVAKHMQVSPKLLNKLLKAFAAVHEMLLEELDDD